jgi:hypothetical protein
MSETNPKPITHKIRWIVVQRLLRPETLAEGKDRLSTEIRLFKILEKMGYDDPDFWLTINLGFKIRSIGWLKNDGQEQLKQAWGSYQVFKKQKEELDKKNKERIISKMQEVNLAQKNIIRPNVKKTIKKLTLIDLLDEKEL